jgi:hypothetical protein
LVDPITQLLFVSVFGEVLGQVSKFCDAVSAAAGKTA